MDIDLLRVVAYVHVLLFVYWLGGDLGVFLCGARIIRDDLSIEERLRIREIGVALDMGPRTALPLMIPVGFTLAQPYGSPITGAPLAALWIFTLVWVGLVWGVHIKGKQPPGPLMLKIDYAIRYFMVFAVGGFGLTCLITGGPIHERWLATKITLFGLIIANGLWLRLVAARFPAALAKARAGGAEKAEGEAMIKDYRRVVRTPVLSIWILVAVMGFLGVVKPF